MTLEDSTDTFLDSRLVEFVNQRILELAGTVTNATIAKALGFESEYVVKMFRTRQVRLPLNKIVRLARAIDADPIHLTRLALEDYWPETDDDLGDLFGAFMTPNERVLIEVYRQATGDVNMLLSQETLERVRQVLEASVAGESGPAPA